MKDGEIEKGDCGPPTRKVFFEILSDLNQAVPNHLADESQTRQPDAGRCIIGHTLLRIVQWCIRLTRLTLVCEVIRYRLVEVRQNLKKEQPY